MPNWRGYDRCELRKAIGSAGRQGGEHLVLSNDEGIVLRGPALFSRLTRDVGSREKRAIPKCFLATELALRPQERAERG